MSPVKEIINFSRIAFEHKLVYGASGNISVRRKNDIYITKSGTYLGFLKESGVIKFNINSSPPPSASMETRMHINCYKADPEIKAVFHSQPFYSAIIASSNIKLNLNFIPETMFYIKNISYVPYNHPGSKALADSLKKKADSDVIVILKNHGLLAPAQNINGALLKTIAFEFLAKAAVVSAASGVKINYLSGKIFNDFQNYIQRLKKV